MIAASRPTADANVAAIDSSVPVELPRLALRTSVLYASLYIHYGFFALLPLWLSSRGATPGEIGTLVAIPMILRLVTVAPFSAWAGRRQRVRGAITATSLLAALLVCGLMSAGRPVERFAVVIVFAITWDQIPVLVDAYAGMAVRRQSLDFGRIRVWASIAVVVSNVFAGWLIGWTGIGLLPLLIAGLLLVPALASRILPPDSLLIQHQEHATGSWRDLFADRALIGAMVAGSFVMGSHGVLTSFGAIQWAADGISTGQIGVLNAIMVAAEIITFTLAGKLLGNRDPRLLILIAAIVASIRWAIMMTHPTMPVLVFAQLLQGFTSAGPLLAPLLLIARRVPNHLAASAQGLNAVLLGAVLAGVTAASGLFWAKGPSLAYGGMVIIALAAVPFLLIGLWSERNAVLPE
jgi:PPP family 3-phenylpropionic acid transporter